MKSDSKVKTQGGRKCLERLNAIPRAQFVNLIDLPNVGKAFVGDLKLLGIDHPRQLIGQDPFGLFEKLCALTQQRHDLCVIDQFIAAIRFMEGDQAKPWWEYTPERKRQMDRSSVSPRR